MMTVVVFPDLYRIGSPFVFDVYHVPFMRIVDTNLEFFRRFFRGPDIKELSPALDFVFESDGDALVIDNGRYLGFQLVGFL